MKWKVLFTTQTEKKNIKQQYHTCKRVYLRKLELFPTSQWCPQIEFSHPAKVLLTLGGINKITHIPQERHGKCCPVKTDFFFLYMAIIRKRNKLTTLIWKKLNSEAKSCVNRQNPTVGKYQLDNQEIGTCIFIFESCFFFLRTSQCDILCKRNQIWTRKERENIYFESLKVSSCTYSKNTIFHSIHNRTECTSIVMYEEHIWLISSNAF